MSNSFVDDWKQYAKAFPQLSEEELKEGIAEIEQRLLHSIDNVIREAGFCLRYESGNTWRLCQRFLGPPQVSASRRR